MPEGGWRQRATHQKTETSNFKFRVYYIFHAKFDILYIVENISSVDYGGINNLI